MLSLRDWAAGEDNDGWLGKGRSRMKVTRYFEHMMQRPDRAEIAAEEIEAALNNPLRTEVQSDGRIRKWAYIAHKMRYLRVVLLDDGETVHNAFYDRDFKES